LDNSPARTSGEEIVFLFESRRSTAAPQREEIFSSLRRLRHKTPIA
jgi:hypothetical protein